MWKFLKYVLKQMGLLIEKNAFFGSFMVNLTLRHTNTQENFSKRNLSEVFLKWFRKYAKSESVVRFMERLFL